MDNLGEKFTEAHYLNTSCFPRLLVRGLPALLPDFPNAKNVWVTGHMAYGYRINQAGIVKSSHGKPKSVDTYWITEGLMAEHAQAGLPADDAYFRYILLQIRLNQHRIADLPEEIQESVFVLTCDLFCNTFPADLDVSGNRTLVKALRTRDFGMYKMCAGFFRSR